MPDAAACRGVTNGSVARARGCVCTISCACRQEGDGKRLKSVRLFGGHLDVFVVNVFGYAFSVFFFLCFSQWVY